MDSLIIFVAFFCAFAMLNALIHPAREGPFSRSWWNPLRQRSIGIMRGVAMGWLLSTLFHKTPIGTWDLAVPIALMVAAHLLEQVAKIYDPAVSATKF